MREGLLDRAGLQKADHRWRRHHHDFDATAQHAVHHFGRTFVRHVLHLDAGRLAEQFGGKMQTVADAGRAVQNAVLLGMVDELLEGFDLGLCVNQDEQAVENALRRNRLEVLEDVEAKLLVDVRRRRDGVRREQNRIAVRFGIGDSAGGDRAIGAKPVLDKKLLAKAGG